MSGMPRGSLLGLVLVLVLRAGLPAADVELGRNGYVSYAPGTLPLVLSAPHGGQLRPEEIPDRTRGTTVTDLHTDRLAAAMADAFVELTGERPHLVVCHLKRTKLDPNRPLDEAAQGSAPAERAWHEYHAFLERARERVAAEHGVGLVVDVHGHAHPVDRLELGYLLRGDDLALDDQALARRVDRSSIRHLATVSGASFVELVRGEDSLGALFARAGVPAVPSPAMPAGDDRYLSGGYITARHGSRDGGVVSAVQIECHRPGLRDSEEARRAFAAIAAGVLTEYLRIHAGVAPAAAR